MTWKFDGSLKKTIGHLLYTMSSFVHHFKAIGEFKLELQSGNAQFGSKLVIFCPVWPQNLTDDLEKQYSDIFPATSNFVLHFIAIYQFKMELQSGNSKFGLKLAIFLSRVTFKFDRWPWKTIGHLFYSTSSVVHHFIAICLAKMELQPGNVQFGSKLAIFCPVWPWNLTMTLKNNRAPLLYYFKLCASFHSHLWIRNGVTVRKCQIWVKNS